MKKKINTTTFNEIKQLLSVKGIKQSMARNILEKRGLKVSAGTISKIGKSATIEEYRINTKGKKPKDFDKHNSLVSLLRVIAENTAETNRLLKTLPLKKRGIFQ